MIKAFTESVIIGKLSGAFDAIPELQGEYYLATLIIQLGASLEWPRSHA